MKSMKHLKGGGEGELAIKFWNVWCKLSVLTACGFSSYSSHSSCLSVSCCSVYVSRGLHRAYHPSKESTKCIIRIVFSEGKSELEQVICYHPLPC